MIKSRPMRFLTRLPVAVTLAVTLTVVLASPGLSAMDNVPPDPVTGRWYTPAELERGQALYAANCAACHGDQAQGQPNWEERDESGYYPAPPLDGTGHSANHPMQQMLRTLDTGGGPMGGTMPSFVDVLSDGDKRAVIAWVQSLWPKGVYETWVTTVHE